MMAHSHRSIIANQLLMEIWAESRLGVKYTEGIFGPLCIYIRLHVMLAVLGTIGGQPPSTCVDVEIHMPFMMYFLVNLTR